MNFLILLAAGNSSRMNNKIKKQYLKIKNKLVLEYSFDTFIKTKLIDKYIIVISPDDNKSAELLKFKQKYQKMFDRDELIFVYGGENRYDSVFNALDYIYNVYNDIENKKVFIHDSARPFVSKTDIINLDKMLKMYNAITLASPITNTIKSIDSKINFNDIVLSEVDKTLDREKLYSIMTPQAFDLDIIYNAHLKFKKQKIIKNITDDLQIIELFTKEKTYLIDSSPLNIKITTKEDLEIYNNLF